MLRRLLLFPVLVVPILLLIAACRPVGAADEPKPKKPKVRLAVVVIFDQMRGDYVEKWQPLFKDSGFKRMQTDGAWFTDCHYPYGTTTTGPGHASILAGCSGNKHGIINNSWFDRKEGSDVNCATSSRYDMTPIRSVVEDDAKPTAKKPAAKTAGNPDRFIGPTLADVLKETTAGAGKVFGVSLKDRSAIFPVGKKADGAYWFQGEFVTSSYYRDKLPNWVADFNKSGIAESYFKKEWTKLREDFDYAKFSGPDDGLGEGKGKAQGVSFPHSMTGGKDKIGKEYYEAVANSPYGNDLLLAFAKACIIEEKLGQDDVPDLLSISFSSNDLIGHTWGPDSQEVLDVTLRSDLIVQNLLTFLDEKVGKDQYSLVITADHGVCPNPEVMAAKGTEAKRISPIALLTGAERHLRETFGKPDDAKVEGAKEDGTKKKSNLWLEANSAPNIYLNQRHIKANDLNPDDVATKLAEWLRTQPGIERAYTRKQLMAVSPTDDPFATPTRKSFHPDRSGDVVVVTKPYYLLDTYATGTTHGTPHPYDTHTVFLAYGPGIAGGKRDEKITPLHASPIVADFLGINPPRNCEYGLPITLAKP